MSSFITTELMFCLAGVRLWLCQNLKVLTTLDTERHNQKVRIASYTYMKVIMMAKHSINCESNY